MLMLPGGDHNRVEPVVGAKRTHDGRKFDCLWSGTKHDQHLYMPAIGRSQSLSLQIANSEGVGLNSCGQRRSRDDPSTLRMIKRPTLTAVMQHGSLRTW
jgi:hypothetical protein